MKSLKNLNFLCSLLITLLSSSICLAETPDYPFKKDLVDSPKVVSALDFLEEECNFSFDKLRGPSRLSLSQHLFYGKKSDHDHFVRGFTGTYSDNFPIFDCIVEFFPGNKEEVKEAWKRFNDSFKGGQES